MSTFLSAAPLVANGALSDPKKGKEKEIDGVSMREEIPDEDDGSTHLMQVKTLKRIDVVNEYSSAGFNGVTLSPFIYVHSELFNRCLFVYVYCHVYSASIFF